MILVYCKNCQLCLRIIGPPDEVDHLVGERSEYWPDKFPCPVCEKRCAGAPELSVNAASLTARDLVELNPQEAFAAFNGMGLPREGDCRAETIETLMREHPVRKIDADNLLGTTRCRLNYIELWDGTKMYFGAGGAGAVIYRVVRPQSYVEKIDGR